MMDPIRALLRSIDPEDAIFKSKEPKKICWHSSGVVNEEDFVRQEVMARKQLATSIARLSIEASYL